MGEGDACDRALVAGGSGSLPIVTICWYQDFNIGGKGRELIYPLATEVLWALTFMLYDGTLSTIHGQGKAKGEPFTPSSATQVIASWTPH